jgi:uncharacterized membrane protein
MTDSNARSLAKAISYRVLGSTGTTLVVFYFSGNMTVSLSAGALDMLLKVSLYFVHERLWNHIPFGRTKPPEYEI